MDALQHLRCLPQVDEVLRGELGQRLLGQAPRWAVVQAVRGEIDRLRQELLAGRSAPQDEARRIRLDAARIEQAVLRLSRPGLRRVLNGTGVILHTNLGRAPLAEAALARLRDGASGYCNLEYRLDEGSRGSRHEHVQALLAHLTGAEAHLVVNNNAAAVLLMLGGHCARREVVVSRGELVEIGGSFRIPDVMRASGARLREVGTTNRTHLSDYEAAIGPRTAALLKVHRSNFAMVGFTHEVPLAELVSCARKRGLLSLCDLGSGALIEPRTLRPDLPAEWTVPEAVRSGCDLVSFSCDKLLGGPQAGILCGRRDLIDRLRRHPLLRALRPDKLTLLALCATLELYRDGRAKQEVPVLRMLAVGEADLRARAEALATRCRALGLDVEVLEVRSVVGGGALPLGQLPSFAVAPAVSLGPPEALHAALREGDPPLVARLAEGRLLCDVRTLADSELDEVAAALRRAVNVISGRSA
ncbi:MAG: L-seryl-tRNA(Sec) selenium transferase [Myxococcales bacterium]|nr:L-seryl-tRNA(Sec) selenium transferase [Myxococcota bacterium]MDW8281004.1 L-seryl-tRNA(Sec) selenium transferase [Myxococcales bacterium]